ncbi:MAG: transcription repressor NadR [Clostridiales bacterium]|nr:transcription repressor NadR [Candidatus Cacconaster stercorequi]
MTAAQRRNRILNELQRADAPISAATLAHALSVTRQVIVGDVALLRAQGHEIAATPRGYLIPDTAPTGLVRRMACFHSAEDTRDELNIMVDCGCTVLDVIVEHPVYGQLTAPLQLASRYDVEQFMQRMHQSDAAPLSLLTEGIHLHTLSCPGEDVWQHLRNILAERGFLLAEQDT